MQKYFFKFRCSDPEVSDKLRYPTFTRMEPTDTQVGTYLVLRIRKRPEIKAPNPGLHCYGSWLNPGKNVDPS